MSTQIEPLTYKRQTLIEKLNERLAERQAKRQADADARDAKNKAAIDRLVEALNATPEFLLQLAETLEYNLGVRITEEDFVSTVAGRYSRTGKHPGVNPPDPDEDIKQLVRVYESAEDDTVKVYVSDQVYKYL